MPGFRVPWVAVGVLLSVAVLVGSFLIRVNAGEATSSLRIGALEREVYQIKRDMRDAAMAEQVRQERLSATLTALHVELAKLTGPVRRTRTGAANEDR
jgi:Tfp pilus assembly protein PilN